MIHSTFGRMSNISSNLNKVPSKCQRCQESNQLPWSFWNDIRQSLNSNIIKLVNNL